MKKLNFEHQSYQTSHSIKQTHFTPIPVAIEVLRRIGRAGSYSVLGDLTVEVRPFMKNVVEFTVSDNAVPLVRCFASYKKQPAQAVADWNSICDELRPLEGATIPPRFTFPPYGLPLTPPIGPFLLIALLPQIIGYRGDVVSMLGDLERSIYWHLHRYYRETS